MKKRGLKIVALIALTGIAQAETIVQNFDTGVIASSAETLTTFNVNKFDTQGGFRTLTRVTVAVSLATWGGYYEVVNNTSPSATVSGSATQGASSRLGNSSYVPDGLTDLRATQTEAFALPANGDRFRLDGPSAGSPSIVSSSANAQALLFVLYEGTGTYAINFYANQVREDNAEGAVTGTFGNASAQGFLTVTYEFVPEPTSLALFAIGCAVLGMRRRPRNTLKG